MTEKPESTEKPSSVSKPTNTKIQEAETKKAVQRPDTPRKRAATHKKTGFKIPKEVWGIIGAVLTTIIASIVAPLTIQAINRTPTPPPATVTPAPPALTATLLPPTATATVTATNIPSPTPTKTPTPTATATSTPQPGDDIENDCLYGGNWEEFPEDQDGISPNECLDPPGAWGISLSDGKLSLFPDLGKLRGVFGIYTSLPKNAVVTLTFEVKLNTNVDFWIGFFDPASSPDQNGVYFSRINGGFYRMVEAKNGVVSNKTTNLAIRSEPPYTLIFTVEGNRLSLKGQDAVKNPIVIGGVFQIPATHNLFIGYRATNANFVSLDAFVKDLDISAP